MCWFKSNSKKERGIFFSSRRQKKRQVRTCRFYFDHHNKIQIHISILARCYLIKANIKTDNLR